MGKDLKFTFKSNIDEKSWDGPLGSFPVGDKLTSTIDVKSNTDANNNLLSIDVKSSKPVIAETGNVFLFKGDDFYPGQKNTTGDVKGLKNGSTTYEQHAKVNWLEEAGLASIGYDKVNIAQKITLNLSGTKLSVTAATDIFPSASLSVNGTSLFNYNQPSFAKTHQWGIRPSPAFYERYKK